MNQYFFILGRNPTLSLAELTSVLDCLNIQYSIQSFSQEAVILQTDVILEKLNLMRILGGIVKFGKIIDEVGLDDESSEFENIFSAGNLLAHFLPKKEGKLHLGISVYNAGGDNIYISKLSDRLKDLNIFIKKNLKEKGLRIGFVKVKQRFLSSVSVAKNRLLTKGVEIVLLVTEEGIKIGKTLAVQEFEKFSFRDVGRPKRDKRSGIMPPKLARIMINLAQIDRDQVLLDPFCGSGTILQEAVVLGYKNIIGTDISQKAISDTKENLNWLKTPRRCPADSAGLLRGGGSNIKLWKTDVRSISKKIPSESIDAIITEPYLGPPLYKKPNIEFIKKALFELSELYMDAFFQFVKILKPGGKIVIIFPVFGEFELLNILDKIKKMGFSQRQFFRSSEVSPATCLPARQGWPDTTRLPGRWDEVKQLTPRNSIIYGSKNQFVRREILSFILSSRI